MYTGTDANQTEHQSFKRRRIRQFVSSLVGALSQVNHKGLCQLIGPIRQK